MSKITLALHAPIEYPGGHHAQIVLRPPTYAEMAETGSPFEDIPLENGETFTRVDQAKIVAWIKILTVEPLADRGALGRATDPRDFRAIESTMRGFFLPPKSSSEPIAPSSSAAGSASANLIA